MVEEFILVLSTLAFGQILLSLPLLVSRANQIPAYWPLAVFLLGMGVIALDSSVSYFLPSYYSIYIAFIFPAWMVLSPSLWLYVQGLTSETPWQLSQIPLLTYLPLLFGVSMTCLLLVLPSEAREGLFVDQVAGSQNIDSGLAEFAAISMFLLMIGWAIQSSYYVAKMVKRLVIYRKKLNDQFANHEQRSLRWFNWLLLIIVVSWGLSFVNLVTTLATEYAIFDYRVGASLVLILVWTICYCGLKQKPGYEGHYLSETSDSVLEAESNSNESIKYQNSALDQFQAERIKDKLNSVMKEQLLYLKPSLTLQQLSQQLAISPNYISQTLNETMETSFFDYVNFWRIECAKPKILDNKKTVLDIAYEVGFNARSSFYKAFKKETGMTPSEFRKSSSSELNS